MRSLYEKLNKLDDSLVESKRVVKKKKLTESYNDYGKPEDWEELDSSETMDDERNWQPLTLWKNVKTNKYVIILGDFTPWEGYANVETDDEEDAYSEFNAYLDEPYYNDDYDDDIDEMLTEAELTPWGKLVKTFPNDFGRESRRSANKTSAQYKTMNDYARDPNTPTYDNKQITTKPEMSVRDKLLKTFPDLDIRLGEGYLKEDMSDTVREFVVNNIELISNNDFETVCRKADQTLTTEQVYEFLDILKGAGIVTIKYNPNADVYNDEQMFEIDYSSIPETEPVETQPEHDTPKQSYSNETQKVPSKPAELSYDQLKDEYPHSVVKGVNTYIKDNENLLKTDVLTFFNNALKKFPYKDFIDTLVYTVVNKLKINIFDINKYNVPLLIAKQYKERYKNISAKIDAEHAKEEEDKKALEQSKKEEKKKLILKDINSGNISDLRYLQLIKYEDTLLKIIYKNKLAYKVYPFDISMSDSYQKGLNSKTAVLLTVRGKVHVYMLFVGKTESDLKQIIARSKIKTEPYDSINDTRKYYSGPIDEIPGYSTGGGVKDNTAVKSASVSYNDLLKYGHADRRDNYQYKYNNQDYWEND